MADKAHRQTDKLIEKIERRIYKTYRDATEEMTDQVNAYFQAFEGRDAEMLAQLQAGEITEAYYTQWRLNQIGRGERYEAMRDALAERMTQANQIAMAYVNDDMAAVYALNHNYTIRDAVKQAGSALKGETWTIYNEDAVKRLLVEQPDVMPYYPTAKAVKRRIDLEYGKRQITKAVTSSIIQGSSTKKMAADLMRRIPDMSRTSAVRAARTAMTEAENAGRQAAAEQLADKGVETTKIWSCTHDSRTRDAHRDADQQEVPYDQPFVVGGEELMFPGDDSMGASPWNVYNCRCVRQVRVTGFKSTLTAEQKVAANLRRVK